jgi:ABC-type Zn uptake system ZnuABC Zn-binding protein ZnuA
MRPVTQFLPMLVLAGAAAAGAAQIEVVTTVPVYASIASAVGGERVNARSISRGDEDAHFVKPKPSYALMLKSADLFVTTGLDLEIWTPTLVDKSGNRSIRDGQPGFVNASQGVELLDVPAVTDRSAGDVHIYGNPHISTSPLNAKIIAANIAAGLRRVDPAGAAAYAANLASFERRIDESLYGAELTALLGPEVLDPLARQGKLVGWLADQELDGVPLAGKLGGWLAKGAAFRGDRILAYHKNWIYFTDLFGLEVVGYVEPKPGIPPSARHVHELVQQVQREGIRILLAASYFSGRQIDLIAERTGCATVQVPLGPAEITRDSYFELVDDWIDRLAAAAADRS